MIRTALVTVAAAATLAGAGGAWLAGAETALAPEPATLTQYLGGTNGATAGAFYSNTSVETRVVKWPGTFTYNTTLAAGTPCSTVDLGPWAQATRVIHASGNYRKCL